MPIAPMSSYRRMKSDVSERAAAEGPSTPRIARTAGAAATEAPTDDDGLGEPRCFMCHRTWSDEVKVAQCKMDDPHADLDRCDDCQTFVDFLKSPGALLAECPLPSPGTLDWTMALTMHKNLSAKLGASMTFAMFECVWQAAGTTKRVDETTTQADSDGIMTPRSSASGVTDSPAFGRKAAGSLAGSPCVRMVPMSGAQTATHPSGAANASAAEGPSRPSGAGFGAPSMSAGVGSGEHGQRASPRVPAAADGDEDFFSTMPVSPFSLRARLPTGGVFSAVMRMRRTTNDYCEVMCKPGWFAQFQIGTVQAVVRRMRQREDDVRGLSHVDCEIAFTQVQRRLVAVVSIFQCIKAWCDNQTDDELDAILAPRAEVQKYLSAVELEFAPDLASIFVYAEFRSNVKQGGSVSSALSKLRFQELVGFHRELSPPPEVANSQEVPEDAAAADKSAAPPSAKKARKEKNVAMLSCYMDRLAKHRKGVNMYVRCFFRRSEVSTWALGGPATLVLSRPDLD